MIGNRARIYQQRRISHWDAVALTSEKRFRGSRIYLDLLTKRYRRFIPPGKRVLELGCGKGDLLASLAPDFGVGIDFSREMVRLAKTRHTECHFVCGDLHDIELKRTFDVLILSDVLNDVWDIQRVLENLHGACHSETIIVVNFMSRVWEIPLKFSRWLGLSRPNLAQNWLTPYDVRSLFELAGFCFDRHWREILLPMKASFLSDFLNDTLSQVWPLQYMNLTNFMTFRYSQKETPQVTADKKVSIIVPIRDESGNIPALFERIPYIGLGTEVIVVEGHSTDQSGSVIRGEIIKRPDLDCRLITQPEMGKADAVFYGMDCASGDVLMVLDGDLSFDPELLQRFYDALIDRKGELINGVRLVYPVEDEAMPFMNLLGNKVFGWIFSGLLGQPIRDTLCGTKALMKKDYCQIRSRLTDVMKQDPFGDFSLLLGAARLNLRICEIPIRYHKRLHGRSKTRTWKDGLLLARVLIKFIFHRNE